MKPNRKILNHWCNSTMTLTKITIMIFLCFVAMSACKNGVCFAKEIVATSQWQRIKEGDTLPAGLHIKVDLSTGEKWARLVDSGNDFMSSVEVSGEVGKSGAN